MSNYVSLSLETHLFFARIMKEHSLFLEAGFPCVNQAWIRKSDWFKQQFERLLREVVQLSDGRVCDKVLSSGEIVTKFTIPAERQTEQLSGISIDSRISMRQHNLNSGSCEDNNRQLTMAVNRINKTALELVNGLINFKEKILEEVSKGKLFNANYPLLIEHTLREAKMYRDTVHELLENRKLSYKCLRETEEFWNRIMMEHASFIRGLLDPTETELIEAAELFACEYKELLEQAKEQDCSAENMMEETLETTIQYRDFKAAGAEGILNCKVASVILPLLADHVLREAHHYIRLLKMVD